MFGNFFSIGEAVLDLQPDGVLDVLHRLFVAVVLAVAALQRRTGHGVSFRVGLDNNRQAQLLHAMDYKLAFVSQFGNQQNNCSYITDILIPVCYGRVESNHTVGTPGSVVRRACGFLFCSEHDLSHESLCVRARPFGKLRASF